MKNMLPLSNHSKLAFFGGSFNPVHSGHISIIRQLCQKKLFETVLVVPTAQNPLKNSKDMLPSCLRNKMLSCSLEDLPVTILDYEQKKNSASYTINTLRYIKTIYCKSTICVIVGSDVYKNILQWHSLDEIVRLAEIHVISRKDQSVLLDMPIWLKEKTFSLSLSDLPNFSSTYIRSHLHNFSQVRHHMPKQAAELLSEYLKNRDNKNV